MILFLDDDEYEDEVELSASDLVMTLNPGSQSDGTSLSSTPSDHKVPQCLIKETSLNKYKTKIPRFPNYTRCHCQEYIHGKHPVGGLGE